MASSTIIIYDHSMFLDPEMISNNTDQLAVKWLHSIKRWVLRILPLSRCSDPHSLGRCSTYGLVFSFTVRWFVCLTLFQRASWSLGKILFVLVRVNYLKKKLARSSEIRTAIIPFSLSCTFQLYVRNEMALKTINCLSSQIQQLRYAVLHVLPYYLPIT